MGDYTEYLRRFEGIQGFSFEVGYIAAIGLMLLIVVLVAALYFILFRYPRRSAGVPMRSPLGEIFVSSHAISDLVKSLEGEFKDIEISKVNLMDCKRFLRLEIHVDYALGGESMTEIGPSLQGKALTKLKDVFGVECIRDVLVKVRRAAANKSPF
jgi:hypothetical protein